MKNNLIKKYHKLKSKLIKNTKDEQIISRTYLSLCREMKMLREQNIRLVQELQIERKQCEKLYLDLGITRVSCLHEDDYIEYETILDDTTRLIVKVNKKYGNRIYTIQEIESDRVGNI